MSQPYNVFISWSGERSRIVAQTLREWLPRVIQAAKPWMSEADIAKGTRGLNELAKALYTMKVGITCLSSDNLEAPWLLFEAGALSKAIDDSSRLCTYLLDGLKPEGVKPPLGMFQASRATKEDTRKLIQTINASVGDEPLRDEDLDEIFEAMWPKLDAAIKTVPIMKPTESIKRNSDDMVAEILELVRAEANRKPPQAKQINPERATTGSEIVLAGITRTQWKETLAILQQTQKFLVELVSQANMWILEGDEVRICFPADKRPFAEMIEGRDSLSRIKTALSEVLGNPVQVRSMLSNVP